MSKFDALCEEVLRSLQEGEIKVGKDAYIDGKDQPTPDKAKFSKLKEMEDEEELDESDVEGDEDIDESEKSEDDDDDEMNEMEDGEDEDEDKVEEGTPNVGQSAHIDGSDLHKSK